MHADIAHEFLDAPGFLGSAGERIAFKRSLPSAVNDEAPLILWCGGLKSDMEGGKATHLHDWAIQQGRAYLRFDYYGHGISSGDFKTASIERWARDTVQIIDQFGKGNVVLIGSSMGGWASLLAAKARPEAVRGLVLIAPAPDFSERLMWRGFSPEIQKQILETGLYLEPSEYGEPMPISKALIEGGRKHLVLDAPIEFKGPVRILQGLKDASVPYTHAQILIDTLTSEDVEMTLVKAGDHRLSTPRDLDRLVETVSALCDTLESEQS